MARTPSVRPDNTPGEVTADAIYTLAEIQQRLKLGQHAMRMARRAGLKVRRIGRRGYVLGRDVLEFIQTVAK
jgi:hypothetical protein